MQVSFTFRQFEPNDEFKDLIQSRIESKLDKFIGGRDPDIRITITTEKAWTTVDMLVNVFGDTFKCSEKTTDLYPTIDVVIDKMERQLRRRKEYYQDRRRRGS